MSVFRVTVRITPLCPVNEVSRRGRGGHETRSKVAHPHWVARSGQYRAETFAKCSCSHSGYLIQTVPSRCLSVTKFYFSLSFRISFCTSDLNLDFLKVCGLAYNIDTIASSQLPIGSESVPARLSRQFLRAQLWCDSSLGSFRTTRRIMPRKPSLW